MYWKENVSSDVVESVAIHGGEATIKRRGFFRDTSRLPISFQIWELGPGASEGRHVHVARGSEVHVSEGSYLDEDSGPLEEIYYFLEGAGTMWIDGRDVPVAAGDAVLTPPGSDHGLRNDGEGPLKLVIIWGKIESTGAPSRSPKPRTNKER